MSPIRWARFESTVNRHSAHTGRAKRSTLSSDTYQGAMALQSAKRVANLTGPLTGCDLTRLSGQEILSILRGGSGRAGSGKGVFKISRVGLGDRTRPDPRGLTRPVEQPCYSTNLPIYAAHINFRVCLILELGESRLSEAILQ